MKWRAVNGGSVPYRTAGTGGGSGEMGLGLGGYGVGGRSLYSCSDVLRPPPFGDPPQFESVLAEFECAPVVPKLCTFGTIVIETGHGLKAIRQTKRLKPKLHISKIHSGNRVWRSLGSRKLASVVVLIGSPMA